MKNFLIKTFIYFITVILSIQIICYIYIKTNFLYGVFNYDGIETYSAIKKSKLKSAKKTLLLGDSLGKQLFPEDNENYNSLTTNHAISIAGNYFLLKNYLNAGNTIESLVIIYNPQSFQNNLDQKLTYHYFLKPFFNNDYNKYFSNNLLTQIRKIPNKNYLSIPSIKATKWSPSFPLSKKSITIETDEVDNNYEKKKSYYLSPISIEYLNMIKGLSIKHRFSIKLLPPPVSTNKKINLISFQKEIQKTDLIEEFKFYLNNINYIDDNYFSDGIHLKNKEIINYNRSKIIKLISD